MQEREVVHISNGLCTAAQIRNLHPTPMRQASVSAFSLVAVPADHDVKQ